MYSTKIKKLKDITPGGIFEAFGRKYVVLDRNTYSVEGNPGVFCLDCGEVETSRFNSLDANVPNNYFRSELFESVKKYLSTLSERGNFLYEGIDAQLFEVSLNELDGSYGYAPVQAIAAPLTLWQFGHYKHLLPKEVFEHPFWLVTPWARLSSLHDSDSVCYVRIDGTVYCYGVSKTLWCRPALLFNPEMRVIVTDETNEATSAFKH